MSKKILAYKLSRPDVSGDFMFIGTTPQEAAEALKNELEQCGECVDDIGEIVVSAYLTTQEEIDNMGEFQGW